MDNPIVYLFIGMIIGLAGALIGIGLMLSSRSSHPAETAPPLDLLADEAIKFVPAASGEWIVEIRGARYQHLSQVRGAVVTQRVHSMLAWLNQFADQPIVALAPPAPPAQPELAARAETAAEPQPDAPAETPAQPASFLQSQPASTPTSRPAAPGAGLFGFWRKSARSSTAALEPEPPEAMGISGQIERALQRRLERMPDMAGRSIHVSSAPDGSLRIEVDSGLYAGVSEVPDQAAREVLQAAIQDWEAGL